MATVLRENLSLLNDKITVRLSKEDYLPAFEQSIKKYAKTSNIPGFRKGMVPVGMVKKMYGPGVYADEVLRAVEKELTGYMEQEQLDIFAQPLPLDSDVRNLDMNSPADYSFGFEVGLKPVINIDFNNINVTRHTVEITDLMIDEEIDRLKTRNGKMTEPTAVETDENVLNLRFIESDASGTAIEGGISKDSSVLMKYFAEGFRHQLIGKQKEDNLIINLQTTFDEKERGWIKEDLGLDKGDATDDDRFFNMTITKVGLIDKPELNEEFFMLVYPEKNLNSEEDFRMAVKVDLQKQWDAQSRNQLHDQIYHDLIDHTPIGFPQNFLKRWIQNGNSEKPKTAEEAENEYPSFENSLKWSLISSHLLDQHQIKVEHSEIKDFAKQQIVGYMGSQGGEDAPWLESYVESMIKDKKFTENTYYQLQTTKLFQFLEDKVNVVAKEVSPDELTSMEHNHAH